MREECWKPRHKQAQQGSRGLKCVRGADAGRQLQLAAVRYTRDKRQAVATGIASSECEKQPSLS
jgi:hypothetical protein